MKKIATLFVAVVCLSATAKESVLSFMNTPVQETEIASKGVRITVYMIKQIGNGGHAWSRTTKSAMYNDDGSITVGGDTYTVRENSYTGGGRENYRYQAGGIYFFNL
ncbi:MAG: hypothetical protein KBT15_08365 [Bacteroidales bacterium]|nr:hypothetical protein [Candidatus Minthousia equi]